MAEVLTSTQAHQWAASRPDPVADLIALLARLRGYERVDRLYYGEEEHRFALESVADVAVADDAEWARFIDDAVRQLGEFRWVLNQFERAAALAYGAPPHANALDYANARRHALFEMNGLKPLEGGY